MVERLYGIEHGKNITAGEIPAIDSETMPGEKLVNELLSLPPDTSVGIEHALELEEVFIVDGLRKITHGSQYWIEIKRICNQQNLEVIYLEDFPTLKEYVRKCNLKEKLDREILEDNTKFRKQNPTKTTEEYEESPEVRRKIREAYKAGVEADYIFIIGREQKILEKIAERQPQVVLLGKGHSDYIMLRPVEFTSRKIPLGQYKVEERKSMPWLLESEEFPDKESVYLLQNPSPDRSELLHRELLQRRYDAVTQGRILPNRIPDYIGTWDLVIPARGLFEIYLNPKTGKNTGRIEDSLGSATFTGVVSENNVIFAKKYEESKSSSEAVKATLSYEADGANEFYVGHFKAVSAYANNKEYPFVMRKFSPTDTLNLS